MLSADASRDKIHACTVREETCLGFGVPPVQSGLTTCPQQTPVKSLTGDRHDPGLLRRPDNQDHKWLIWTHLGRRWRGSVRAAEVPCLALHALLIPALLHSARLEVMFDLYAQDIMEEVRL